MNFSQQTETSFQDFDQVGILQEQTNKQKLHFSVNPTI